MFMFLMLIYSVIYILARNTVIANNYQTFNKITITIKNVYDDGVRICVAWVTRIFSWIRAGRSLYEQITSSYFAFLRDNAHPTSSWVIVYFLKLSQGLMEENHDKLIIVCILCYSINVFYIYFVVYHNITTRHNTFYILLNN